MDKLVIDRQEWCRNPQKTIMGFKSALNLGGDFGFDFCCLGLWLRDVHGYKPEDLEDNHTPWQVKDSPIKDVPMYDRNNPKRNTIFRLMAVNDRGSGIYDWEDNCEAPDWSNMTNEQQEELIRIGFRELNVEVEFVN